MVKSMEIQPYYIPMFKNDEATADCNKTMRKCVKFSCCCIPWCFLFIFFGYFLFHYQILYQSHSKLNATLNEKIINESVMQAKLEDLKHVNTMLKVERIALENNMQLEKEKLKNAEDKIDIYMKRVQELNKEVATLENNLGLKTEKLKIAQERLDSYMKTIEELNKAVTTLRTNLELETEKLKKTQDEHLKNVNGLKEHFESKLSSQLMSSGNTYHTNKSCLFIILFVRICSFSLYLI